MSQNIRVGLNSLLKMFLINHLGKTMNWFVMDGCMNGNALERFIDLILERGLEYKDKETVDFVVINTLSGASWDADWLEYDLESCYIPSPSLLK